MDKQTFDEIVTKYELEDSVKDIYVEGEDDRSFYATHYKQGGKTFWDISSIDFSKEKPELEKSDYEAGNRDKIIYLLNYLKEKNITNVRGIIDKDILLHTRGIPDNEFIWTTDYSCLEMYFFTKENIEKVQRNTLKTMTLSFIEDVMKKLQSITAIRIVEKQMNLSLRKPDMCSCIVVDGKKGILIDENKYVKCLFDKSDKEHKGQMVLFKNKVEECKKNIKDDNPRDCLNGHDLIAALTQCVKKIEKNKANDFPHMREAFLAAIYKNAVETADMEKTALFQKMVAF